jgi:hypothetical protein
MPGARRYASNAARQAAYRRRVADQRRAALADKGLPALPGVAAIPGHARWRALIEQAHVLLATVQGEMAEYYADRSERWQESERGEGFQERLQRVEEADHLVEELLD